MLGNHGVAERLAGSQEGLGWLVAYFLIIVYAGAEVPSHAFLLQYASPLKNVEY